MKHTHCLFCFALQFNVNSCDLDNNNNNNNNNYSCYILLDCFCDTEASIAKIVIFWPLAFILHRKCQTNCSSSNTKSQNAHSRRALADELWNVLCVSLSLINVPPLAVLHWMSWWWWKHPLHYWPFVRGIHQSLVDSPHKGPEMLWCRICFVIWANCRKSSC